MDAVERAGARMSNAYELGPMPTDRSLRTVDERVVRAAPGRIFALAADVEGWPIHLPHYRYVRFLERRDDGGGLVEMSANRPFGPLDWPTRWTSLMAVTAPSHTASGSIRFRHVRGVTTGMDVEWTFDRRDAGTLVRIVHVWNGPEWPVIGGLAAHGVIGPVFVHGIASRTLAGLGRAAERSGAPPSGAATSDEVSSG
jgi:ribosome-associated toxin RatA of RatAB toxin-antitoxin module